MQSDTQRFSMKEYEQAVAAIRNRSIRPPKIGLVLGSGLRSLADELENPTTIPYEDIPHFPQTTVEGHDGRLISGTLRASDILVMQGRAHYYEGYSMQQVTFPIRVMCLLGIDILVVTNAAGGLNPNFAVGDLMLIADHINFPGMAGHNPLRGPNLAGFGPRFPDMTRAYDPNLRALAREVGRAEDLPLHEGVYMMLGGPNYETPAEIRFLRKMGVDAVGMSTVPEVTVAVHCGLRVLGISGITNVAITDPDSGHSVAHQDVLDAGRILGPRMTRLISGVLRKLS